MVGVLLFLAVGLPPVEEILFKSGVESQIVREYPAKELLTAVTRTVQANKLDVSEDAIPLLRDFVARGAESYEPQRRDEAFTSAGALGQRLVDLARERKSSSVTSAIAKAVVESICPLFPFCK